MATNGNAVVITFGFIEVFPQTVSTGNKNMEFSCPRFTSLAEIVEFYGGEDRLIAQMNRQLKTDFINKIRPKLKEGWTKAKILEFLGYEVVEEDVEGTVVTFHRFTKFAPGTKSVDPVLKPYYDEVDALMKEYKKATPERQLAIMVRLQEINTAVEKHRNPDSE